ncbi:MAG TPA: segregation/condensation protein A [Candidatus Acidoferrum sp.]|nr:segregation/condensation protein A [Candidatus Acidoferrum sp.]
MATAETTTAVAYRELDLQEFVQNATWRELLIDLVSTNQLDPWNIDIAKIVDHYLKVIKRMKVLDLIIPANMVLAASILLRMKSDTITIFSTTEEQAVEEQIVQQARVRPEVEPLVPVARIQPKRRVTLSELLEALDQAMKIEQKHKVEHEREMTPINLFIDTVDIEDKKKMVQSTIERSLDKEGVTTFAIISKGVQNLESALLDLFVPLLFLAHENRVAVLQDQFFGEIFIRMIEGEKVARRARN